MSKKVSCKNCDGGEMYRKKKYVLGIGGAILRFMMMIPGFFIIVMGLMGLIGGGAGVTSTSEFQKEGESKIRMEYQKLGLSFSIIDDILDDGKYSGDKFKLDEVQRKLITDAESEYLDLNFSTIGSGAASVAAGGFGMIGVLVGIMMCAFGFLIGIRKWKLICDSCGASISAA